VNLLKLNFNDKLVKIQVNVKDSTEALRVAAQLLHREGVVKDSYESAIIERESVYPTGLPTEPVGVAIPHTDIEHVNYPGIAVLTLKHPIKFQLMGDPEGTVQVSIIFALAITDHHAQLETLEQLTSIFQDVALLESLANLGNAEEVVRTLATSFAKN
jgi:galactitol PTS system EIIA component